MLRLGYDLSADEADNEIKRYIGINRELCTVFVGGEGEDNSNARMVDQSDRKPILRDICENEVKIERDSADLLVRSEGATDTTEIERSLGNAVVSPKLVAIGVLGERFEPLPQFSWRRVYDFF